MFHKFKQAVKFTGLIVILFILFILLSILNQNKEQNLDENNSIVPVEYKYQVSSGFDNHFKKYIKLNESINSNKIFENFKNQYEYKYFKYNLNKEDIKQFNKDKNKLKVLKNKKQELVIIISNDILNENFKNKSIYDSEQRIIKYIENDIKYLDVIYKNKDLKTYNKYIKNLNKMKAINKNYMIYE